MKIEIKKSKKPVKYKVAIQKLENRVKEISNKNTNKELIWFLEHPPIYTAGTSYKKEEIIDKKIKIIETSRGGKITWHGPGQLICYFVIDLSKRKKDIRKFLNLIEKSIIESLSEFKIKVTNDKKNIGIWYKSKNSFQKVGSIGIRIKKWIAYHGFSININNDLLPYNKIITCGINNRSITNLKNIKKNNYTNLSKILSKKLINNLKT